MKKLVNPNLTPIGGYTFTDPDTGYIYNRKYSSYEELASHIHEYRTANKLPPISKLRAVWEHYCCENIPGMESRCQKVSDMVARNFRQFWQGGKSFIKAALSGSRSFVEQLVADNRSAICRDCDQNVVNIGHRHSQFYTDKFMLSQIGARRSKFHDELHTCKICSCILKAKVFYSDSLVGDSLSDDEIGKLSRMPRNSAGRPLKCWQLDSVKNTREE